MSRGGSVVSAPRWAFCARDVERALATMHPDVEWPNGMEGGYVHGPDALRDYSTRQCGQIDPRVEPRRLAMADAGRIVGDVHRLVRDRAGTIVADQMVATSTAWRMA
jgi:hypothetical protein